MSLLAVLAAVFGIVNGLANFPQIYKIFRTKSARDISKLTYILLTTGSFIWILYGIEINNIPVLVMNGLAFVEFVLILVGCYFYG